MRIQETNQILNEARVQRKSHEQEVANSKRWSNRIPKMLGSRRVQAGILTAVAVAVGLGAARAVRRRGDFSFSR